MYYTYDVFENIAGDLSNTRIQESNYLRVFDKLMTVYRGRGRCVGDWVDVPYNFWVKNFANFKPYLDDLINNKHITRDNSYSCGIGSNKGFSKRYKLNVGYIDQPVIKPVPEHWLKKNKDSGNKNVPDNFWNHIQQTEESISYDLDLCGESLTKKIDSIKLIEITDQYTAIETTKGHHYQLLSFLNKIEPGKILVQSSDANDSIVSIIKKDLLEFEEERVRHNRYGSCMNLLTSLHHPHTSYAKRDDGGRLYTKMTNLPSVFMNHLQLNKEHLVEFDLANCQPLLLAYEYGNSPEIKKQSQSGNFYSWLSKETGFSLKEVKRNFLSMMFSRKNNTPIADHIFQFLEKCDSKFTSWFKKTRGKNLSLLMRRKESKLFINSIFSKIVDKNLPAFSRHDAVLTNLSNQNKIEQIIKESLEESKIKGELRINTFDGRFI